VVCQRTQSPSILSATRELRAVLNGEMKLEEAQAAIQQATRRYAKRQLTWFRRDTQIHWLSGFGQDAAIQEQALGWRASNCRRPISL